MQSPWTRDGKVRAELVNITPEISGKISKITVHDNQWVQTGALVFEIDPAPFILARDSAAAKATQAQSELIKAQHEATRRRNLPKNTISTEALDVANLASIAMEAADKGAVADLQQAEWNLTQTRIYAPTAGYITNLQTRVGNYATAGTPLVALVDSQSFYIIGYFEETKIRHIHEGQKADIVIYNGNQTLQGIVESIGRAIDDQSVGVSSTLLPNVTPNVPWVRLAQRVPVRIKLVDVPEGTTLIAGTTCTISLRR